MELDSKLIDELARRIVEAVHPLRIILFGSAARDEMKPNSDLDVLVVMPDGIHRRKTAQEIYRRIWGFGFAKDIIVVTESDIREYSSNPIWLSRAHWKKGGNFILPQNKPIQGSPYYVMLSRVPEEQRIEMLNKMNDLISEDKLMEWAREILMAGNRR